MSTETRFEELERTCFLIMPFGKKEVGGKEVDFTAIYNEIFEPAISEVFTIPGARPQRTRDRCCPTPPWDGEYLTGSQFA